MKEGEPLKSLLGRDDLLTLGNSYLDLSEFLNEVGRTLPAEVWELPKDIYTGHVIAITTGEGPPMSLLKILLDLKTKELKGINREISRNNVVLASYLGGTALGELYERTEGKELPFELAKGIATAVGSLQENIELALDDASGSAFVRDLLEETGGLIYSRRGGTPDQKPKVGRRSKTHRRNRNRGRRTNYS